MRLRSRFTGSFAPLVLLPLLGFLACKEVPDLPKCKEDGVDPSKALDLMEKGRDPNGILLAPSWNIQEKQAKVTDRKCAVDVVSPRICGGFPKVPDHDQPGSTYGGNPSCTSQATADPIGHYGVNADLAHTLFSFLSYLGPKTANRPDWSHALLGHVNWQPVTFEGWLSFDDSGAADRDVNFALEVNPDGGAPFTAKQLAADSTLEAGQGGRLHLEIHADQSTHHFGDSLISGESHRPTELPRFVELTSAADNTPGREKLRQDLSRRRAVATGLLALDLDHEIFTELHPLYSLLWQDSCVGATETWALLFSNRGAQGWVSSGLNHYLALPRPSFTVGIPTTLRTDAAPADPELARKVIAAAKVDLRSNEGRKVTYSLKPSPRGGLIDLILVWGGEFANEVRVHGTITLPWPPGTKVCPPPAAVARAPGKPLPPHGVEHFGHLLSELVKAPNPPQVDRSEQPQPPSLGEAVAEGLGCHGSDCDSASVDACSDCIGHWSTPPGATCASNEVCDYLESSDEASRRTARPLLRPGRTEEDEICDSVMNLAPERQRSLSAKFLLFQKALDGAKSKCKARGTPEQAGRGILETSPD
jgi:hypothetical protein